MSISVVIPLYNKARHIERTIKSVLAQTVPDFELIVVDDGSTDGGADLVLGVRDPRVRLVRQAHAGASVARNRGISEATGDSVAFLDADDEWLPDFLETVTGMQSRLPEAGMYATAHLNCDKGVLTRPWFIHCPKDPRGGYINDYFRSSNGPSPVCSSTVLIPKGLLEQVGGFPVGVHLGEDRYLWARIALLRRVAWSPNAAAIYHLSTDNRATHLSVAGYVPPSASVIEEFLHSGKVPVSSSRRSLRRCLTYTLALSVVNTCRQGESDLARRLVRQLAGRGVIRWRWSLLAVAVWAPRPLALSAFRARALYRRFERLLMSR